MKTCPDFVKLLEEAPESEVAEQLLNCFASHLQGLARHLCRDVNMAEDTFQEAMRIALESMKDYRGEAPIQVWLSRLVRTACSRQRRGRKNQPAWNLPLDEAAVGVAGDAPDAEARVLLAQRLEILGKAVMEIDEPNRSLFLLHEGEEMPLAELAGRFDLTEDGVKARLRRTRARLRERLLQVARGEEEI